MSFYASSFGIGDHFFSFFYLIHHVMIHGCEDVKFLTFCRFWGYGFDYVPKFLNLFFSIFLFFFTNKLFNIFFSFFGLIVFNGIHIVLIEIFKDNIVGPISVPPPLFFVFISWNHSHQVFLLLCDLIRGIVYRI